MQPSIQDIEAFGRLIAERFSPEKIILFGSYAYGSPTEDSDVDLLVVMPHTGSAREKAFEIKSALPRPFPLDLIVRSGDELDARISLNDPFVREIAERGRTIYERGN